MNPKPQKPSQPLVPWGTHDHPVRSPRPVSPATPEPPPVEPATPIPPIPPSPALALSIQNWRTGLFITGLIFLVLWSALVLLAMMMSVQGDGTLGGRAGDPQRLAAFGPLATFIFYVCSAFSSMRSREILVWGLIFHLPLLPLLFAGSAAAPYILIVALGPICWVGNFNARAKYEKAVIRYAKARAKYEQSLTVSA